MIARFIANLKRKLREAAIERENLRGIAEQRVVRLARAEAARRGISTEIKRRAANCRAMFPEIAR